jgi:hypothetical protein
MNDLTQTLFRSVLKIGAGYAIAKGFTDDATAQVIISGFVALAAVVWGVLHRTGGKPTLPTALNPSMFILAALLSVTGCAYVSVYDDQKQAGFKSVVPAWPWQDSTRVLDKMNVSSKTNAFTASVRGLSDSETTSTNTVDLVSKTVSAAVSAAVTSAK